MKDLPASLRQYWAFRDELSVEDGLLLKVSRVIIPSSRQDYILAKIHEGHHGTTKCQLRAKECVYWSDINKDIEKKLPPVPYVRSIISHRAERHPYHQIYPRAHDKF
jgi:hypothetical protein